ncbi:hypothetical protein ABTM39_20100, partial [Acinetobacter baumannii]
MTTAAAVWALLSEPIGLPLMIFVLLVLVALWAGALHAVSLVTQRINRYPLVGHRIRESSRADLRDRMTNARATFYTSLYTV